MARGGNFSELCEKIKYTFKSKDLIECALTHSSYSNEMRQKNMFSPSNERLEFLGDSVLQLVISEYLYDNYSNLREGALTRMRQQLVCEKSLERVGRGLEIGKYLNVGHGDEITGLRERTKVIADAVEALIGAVYLDSAPSNEYKRVIADIFESEIRAIFTSDRLDYKTMLQQLVEKDGAAILEYKVVAEDGPEHCKCFTVEAFINNNRVGQGIAKNKKDAEMLAAKEALLLFGVSV